MSMSNLPGLPQIPQMPSAIQRASLLARLRQHQNFKVILISAPPGYGKTTLLAQFAAQTGMAVAWHSLSPREHDLSNLYDLVIKVLKPIIGSWLPETREEVLAPAEFARIVADGLEQCGMPCLLILDDLHHLSGSAGEVWLTNLIESLPQNARLMLASRTIPGLGFSDLISRQEIIALSEQDLRLTEDEIQQLARQMLGDDLPTLEINHLIEDLGAWPAGVMLSLQPLAARLHESIPPEFTQPEALFDSLAHVMLQAQPPSLRQFLLTSSTLAFMTPDLCAQALGLEDAAQHMMAIQRQNLFCSKVAGGLVYHVLFREFLQGYLRTSTPDEFARLHLKAAHWFEQTDQLDDAFNHYLMADAPQEAASIADRMCSAYFPKGYFEVLLDWSKKLQALNVVAPMLSYHCAMIHTDRYEYLEATAELDRAEWLFTEQNDESGLAKVQLQRARLLLQQGEYDEAIQLALPHAAPNSHYTLRGRALRVIGMSTLYLGDATSAVEHLREALGIYREANFVLGMSHLLQDLEIAYTHAGRLHEAGECLKENVALRRQLAGRSALALALNNLGYYYHQRSAYQDAMATYSEASSLIAGIPEPRTEAYLALSLGDLKRDLGHFDEAERLYFRALEKSPLEIEAYAHILTLISLATLRRRQHHYRDALIFAEEAAQASSIHSQRFEAALSEAAQWAIRAESEQVEGALNQIVSIYQPLRAVGPRFELLWVLGVGAVIAIKFPDPLHPPEWFLNEAHLLASELGTAQTFAVEISSYKALVDLVQKQFPDSLITSDLQKLKKAKAKIRPSIVLSSDELLSTETYSLRVLTFGVEQVYRDGALIENWEAAGAKLLFFNLLFRGARSREELNLESQPDTHPVQARNILNQTIYRARQAVGGNVIVFDNQSGLYSLNSNVSIWCDAIEFQRFVEDARGVSPRDPRTENLYERALRLATGEFLPSLDADWIGPLRERLIELKIEALAGLGRCAAVGVNYKKQIDLLHSALEIDYYKEDLHREVIGAYAAMGDRGKLQAHYRELVRRFKIELGVSPSVETIEFVRPWLMPTNRLI